MTVPEIYAAALELFGATRATATAEAKARCLLDINAAIQQMAGAGEDFYGRSEETITLLTGILAYELPKAVQSVLDPVYLAVDGTILRKLSSRGQLQQFAQLFQDSLSGALIDGKPVAYFVAPLRDSDGETGAEDSVKVELRVLPAPGSTYNDTDLVLYVINEPEPLILANLTDASKHVPVPHKYIESIFLPLVRWNASTSYFFVQKKMLERISQDYERALGLLGLVDPRQAHERVAEALLSGSGPAAPNNQRAAA